jgi:transcriptional regulator with XRE-family HTH domain
MVDLNWNDHDRASEYGHSLVREPGTAAEIVAAVATSLRQERERAGISLTELARRAGIAKSTLSQLEAGSGNPGLETLWALAAALHVPLSRLVDPPRRDIHVIRAGEGAEMRTEGAEYSAVMLAACPPGARRDVYRICAQPGPYVARPHVPGTTEHVFLCTGRALVGPENDAVELRPGDYLRYPADVPHVFDAQEPDTIAVLITEDM